MSEEPTSFIEKVGEGIGKGLVRGIASLLAACGIFGGSVAVSLHKAHTDAKETVWKEAGDHLLDEHNEIYSNQAAVKALEQRVKQLEAQNDNRTNSTR